MRFMLSSTALSSRLLLLSKVLNNKNAMQILDCFLFEIENGKLMLTASDNENAMRMSIGLNESDQNGKFAINSHWILDAVKATAPTAGTPRTLATTARSSARSQSDACCASSRSGGCLCSCSCWSAS